MHLKLNIFQHRIYQAMIIGLILLAGNTLYGESTAQWYVETRDLYYGLPIRVTYFPEDAELSASLWAYLEKVGLIFNDYKPDSEISRINQATPPGKIALSPELADGFSKAKQAYVLSEGVFDITCAPIRKLWREAEKNEALPSLDQIQQVRETCGLDHVKLSKNELERTRPAIQFDFGGIIKGIAADHVIKLLKKGGATSALVQIGGETAAFGHSKKARPYRIAIPNPMEPYEIWCVIHNPAGDLSGSTSGNYENPILINGETFYHIFDPRTGRPAQTQVISVSILFPEAGNNWMTDSLTTAGVLLGPEKTFAIIKPLGGEALFILHDKDGLRSVKSDGWDSYQL